MSRSSQFWLDRLAGKPLSAAWAKKDAQIARDTIDDLPMAAWLKISDVDQVRLLRQTLTLEAAQALPMRCVCDHAEHAEDARRLEVLARLLAVSAARVR